AWAPSVLVASGNGKARALGASPTGGEPARIHTPTLSPAAARDTLSGGRVATAVPYTDPENGPNFRGIPHKCPPGTRASHRERETYSSCSGRRTNVLMTVA